MAESSKKSKDEIKSILKNHKKHVIQARRYKYSAVLLLLYERNQEPHILLTKRTDNLKKHRGEISCPGGSMEPEDETLLDTALRETEEEISIPRNQIEILGELEDMFTLSRYIITPFVGFTQYPFDIKVSNDEVEYVIEVPLNVFLTKDLFSENYHEFQGKKFPIYYYTFNEHVIWGATAYMINQFIQLIFNYNPSAHPEFKRWDPKEFSLPKLS